MHVIAIAAFLAIALAPRIGAAEEARPSIRIENATTGPILYRIKLWQGDFTEVKAGRSLADTISPKYTKESMQVFDVVVRSNMMNDECVTRVRLGGRVTVNESSTRIWCSSSR